MAMVLVTTLFASTLHQFEAEAVSEAGREEAGLVEAILQNRYGAIRKMADRLYSKKYSSVTVRSPDYTFVRLPSEIDGESGSCLFPVRSEIRHYGRFLGEVVTCLSFPRVVEGTVSSPLFILILISLFSAFFLILKESLHEAFKNEKIKSELEHSRKMGQMSRQVAHDIRSPLTALNVLLKSASGMSEDQKKMLVTVVDRINGIADDLLCKTKSPGSVGQPVGKLLDEIVDEKKTLLHLRPHIQIISQISSDANDRCIQASDFKRVISNIINNSIEALHATGGKVILKTQRQATGLLIEISDDGPGIPEPVLNQLKSGKSVTTKSSGNGLGLYAAFNVVRSWGGKINIFSGSDVGTRVIIEI